MSWRGGGEGSHPPPRCCYDSRKCHISVISPRCQTEMCGLDKPVPTFLTHSTADSVPFKATVQLVSLFRLRASQAKKEIRVWLRVAILARSASSALAATARILAGTVTAARSRVLRSCRGYSRANCDPYCAFNAARQRHLLTLPSGPIGSTCLLPPEPLRRESRMLAAT